MMRDEVQVRCMLSDVRGLFTQVSFEPSSLCSVLEDLHANTVPPVMTSTVSHQLVRVPARVLQQVNAYYDAAAIALRQQLQG